MRRFLCYLLFLSCIATPMLSAAQVNAEEYHGPYAFAEGSEQFIWADSANLRESADMWSRPVAIFPAGTAIKLGKPAGLLTAGKKTAPWYEATVTSAGETKRGFIWGGLLSLAPLRKGDVRFVFGLESLPRANGSPYDTVKDTTARMTVLLKAVQNSRVLDRTSYNIFEESINAIGGQVLDGRKLPAINAIVRLGFSGEACGIPGYTHDFAWDGTHLIPLPPLLSVSDAGVFYHEETALYPGDKGGQPNAIVHIIREGSFDEKKDRYRDKKPVREVYLRDGNKEFYRKR